MRSSRATLLCIGVILFVGCAVFLPSLGQQKIMDGREVRHAEIAREMLTTGEYMVPHILGQHYTMKPPLFNWTVAAAYRIMNRVDLFAARLVSALSAILAAVAIFLLGRRWANARAGLWAAVVWLTIPLVMDGARAARMDMMMACLILYGFLFGMVAAEASTRGRAWPAWIAACLLISAATMSKGPQAIFFFLVMLIPAWRARTGRWLPQLRFLLPGAVLMMLVPVVWGAVCEWRMPGYLHALLSYQLEDSLVIHRKRPWLYLDQLLVKTVPWSLFVPGAIYFAVRRIRQAGYDIRAGVWLALAAAVFAMSFIPNKRAHYLLPILPMWALGIGLHLEWLMTAAEPLSAARRWLVERPLRACLLASGVGGVAGALLLTWAVPNLAAWVAVVCAAVAILGTAGMLALNRGRRAEAVGALAAAMLVISIAWHPLTFRWLDPETDVRVAQEITQAIPPGMRVADYASGYDVLYLLLNRPVDFLTRPDEVAAFARSASSGYVVVPTQRVSEAVQSAPASPREIGHWHLARHRSVTLLAFNQP